MERISFQKPDLHMHSVYSDGTDTPESLLQNVRAAGLDLFALTDHDTAEGGAAVRALLRPGDPAFIGGVEFSCRDGRGKYHVLGYGFDAYKEEYCDMVAAGIIDPAKVTRSALENAASVSGMVLTTESLVADKPEPKVPAAPAAPDMGGMY